MGLVRYWTLSWYSNSERTNRGRLIAPNYFTTRENGKVKSYSHIIYSDDYGKTWKPGEPTPVSGVGECSVAEIGEEL